MKRWTTADVLCVRGPWHQSIARPFGAVPTRKGGCAFAILFSAALLSGCVAVWGKSYNVAKADSRSVVIEYDPSLANYPAIRSEARSACEKFGKDAVFEGIAPAYLGIKVMTYRCEQRAPVTGTVTPVQPTAEAVQGTAFAVRADGTLLTAFHLVREAKTVRASCGDAPSSPATIAASAARVDLAVLRIRTATPVYLTLAKSGGVKVGEPVFTVGFPAPEILGRGPKFTEGTVSALTGPGDEATLLQTTVPIQPGNSGGPLANEKGEAVGIVTSTAAVRAFLAMTGTLPQNINWAVKAEFAAPLFERPVEARAVGSREEAISRALRSVCLIEAEK